MSAEPIPAVAYSLFRASAAARSERVRRTGTGQRESYVKADKPVIPALLMARISFPLLRSSSCLIPPVMASLPQNQPGLSANGSPRRPMGDL
ncbi:hypothetical protein K523DRAFT_416918 [Schizophyllum commune Tattone D]|nr:hypothetical protein K523DRAFT_416918 [Schizophyllum commune Tattone D]